jgi:hypothetical protein
MVRRCPQCGNEQVTPPTPIDVTLTAPDWWPAGHEYTPARIGTVDRQNCFRCGWERETWSTAT